MDKHIEFEDVFREKAPGYTMVYVEADVVNGESSPELIRELETTAADIASRVQLQEINKIPAIAATRQAYKRMGKDPNRYRPSQEQLMRRIVRGLGLYYVDNLVDTGNLMSVMCGSSLGVFDRDKIAGDILRLGVGKENEPYEGIGRGPLNIEGLPVIRDSKGGIGTPTSDNERTKVSLSTTRISICLNMYDVSSPTPEEAADTLRNLLIKYCNASNIEIRIVTP